MTPARRKEWQSKLFHNLKQRAAELKTIFDINLFVGVKEEDIEFATVMFFRRHVYEHNGGEVDARYLKESGDTSVRVKQVIRENMATALRICELVMKIGTNLHTGFHEIFSPEDLPLKLESDRKRRLKIARPTA